jgi:hypothetical protein
MTPAERALALEHAQTTRLEVVELRRRIRRGEVALVDLLDDPPACIHGMGLVDVLRFSYTGSGRARIPRRIESLGREAARDGINLLVPIERASMRTRRWLVVRASWYVCRTRCELRAGKAAA